MYEDLLQLDTIRINFSAGGMHIINLVLAFVMFGVALGRLYGCEFCGLLSCSLINTH